MSVDRLYQGLSLSSSATSMLFESLESRVNFQMVIGLLRRWGYSPMQRGDL